MVSPSLAVEETRCGTTTTGLLAVQPSLAAVHIVSNADMQSPAAKSAFAKWVPVETYPIFA